MSQKHLKLPESFIDELASIVYSQENIERANAYARTRGIDPSVFTFPWAATGPDMWPFERFRPIGIAPVVYTEVLLIPVVEIDCDPAKPRLAGFDIRYLGQQAYRHRWTKRKRTEQTNLVYNAHAALKGDALIVTEGAIDAEAFRTCGWEACAALTALKTPRFVHFLYALGTRIYLAFDNDDDGKKATKYIIDYQAKFTGAPPVIQPLIYPMKDPGKAIETLGRDAFKQHIAFQLTG